MLRAKRERSDEAFFGPLWSVVVLSLFLQEKNQKPKKLNSSPEKKKKLARGRDQPPEVQPGLRARPPRRVLGRDQRRVQAELRLKSVKTRERERQREKRGRGVEFVNRRERREKEFFSRRFRSFSSLRLLLLSPSSAPSMRALTASAPAPRRLAAAGKATREPRIVAASVAAPRRRNCLPIPPLTPHAVRRRRSVLASSSSSPEQQPYPPLSPDDVVDGSSDEAALESAALRALLLCWFGMQVSFFLESKPSVKLLRWRFPPTAPRPRPRPRHAWIFLISSAPLLQTHKKLNTDVRSAPSSPPAASSRPASPSTAAECLPRRQNPLSPSRA